jgi:acyl-CoA thioester hydrolase
MRWADLDPLGHVNNVVYVDYLQEARVDMLRTHGPAAHTGELAEGVVVVRHEVQYVAPLAFRFKPVSIECWVTELRIASFTMAYEIFQDDPDRPGERLVHVRATTVLTPYVFATERPRRLSDDERQTLGVFLEPRERTPREKATPVPREKVGHYPVHVRFSDVDVYGHVNNVKYFEYFQEARILLQARLWRDLADWDPSVVVAQLDADYKIPILFRPETYDLWSSVTRVGERSMTIESEICDGDTVLSRARSVIVFFDPASGRSTAPPTAYRERLLAVLA